MLNHLTVRDFAIVDEIDVEFAPGMSVLTGETGAGKSILVDAIALVLGERGGGQVVRKGARRAEFSAHFDIADQPQALAWLAENELDDDESCLLRRVVGADGRSRAFINGQAVTLRQLKALGELLLDIHGQHFHQSLGRKPIQRELLDFYGNLGSLALETRAAFGRWQALEADWQELRAAERDRASRLELVSFQLDELETLDLGEDEVGELLAERQKLQHGGRLAEGVAAAVDMLSGNEEANAAALLAGARRAVEAVAEFDRDLGEVLDLLESAGIQLSEAADTLERYAESIDMDPERRDHVERRLDAIQAIARKHRVEPEELVHLADELAQERDALAHAEERGVALEREAAAAREAYEELADRLSAGRRRAAKPFSRAVSEAMEGLGMPGGRFEVSVEALPGDEAKASGRDDVEFRITANPGQPLMPLSRVASGGELSRMSLAIQVIASHGSAIPTMVFDEVDSGVGGRVAEMVGRRLQELGTDRQVLCVTHLPQVACLADQHFRVSKVTDGKATRTGIQVLGDEERVQEIARMLGGVEITSKTLEHAAEMLAGAARKKRA